MNSKSVESPLGKLTLFESDGYIIRLSFDDSLNCNDHSGLMDKAQFQLNEYFQKKRKRFDLPLKPEGTEFQKRFGKHCLKYLSEPCLAMENWLRKLGDPKKMRAIGAANGRNPIPVIIPCHRVVGKEGNMIGFSGGVERKIKLLEHEGALLPFG